MREPVIEIADGLLDHGDGQSLRALVVQHAGRILPTTSGAIVAQDSLPIAGLEPGRYTLSATIAPGGAPPFTRTFTVAGEPPATP